MLILKKGKTAHAEKRENCSWKTAQPKLLMLTRKKKTLISINGEKKYLHRTIAPPKADEGE
jgi:hypothetical protein